MTRLHTPPRPRALKLVPEFPVLVPRGTDDVLVRAATYPRHSLFAVVPWQLSKLKRVPTDYEVQYFVESPCGKWRYVENLLPRNEPLDIYDDCPPRRFVSFDAPVALPALYQRSTSGSWLSDPWMSISPAEQWSLAAGVRRAEGHTIVAGLGLGWQLLQVLRKPTVSKVTLVEHSQGLVDWLLPHVLQLATEAQRAKLKHVRVVDAYKSIPRMKADVALIDIYPYWTENRFQPCSRIKKVWVWGR